MKLTGIPEDCVIKKTTRWLAEEVLDGQRQRVDIPAHASNAHNAVLERRLLNRPPCSPGDKIGQKTELN